MNDIFDFTPLSKQDASIFKKELMATFKDLPPNIEDAKIAKAVLPFYDDYAFYQVNFKDKSTDAYFLLLWKPGDAVPIDMTNEPIYRVNEIAPIKVEDDTVIPYARFFFHFVRGQLGHFVIIEKPEQVPWVSTATEEQKSALNALLMPVTNHGLGEDNFYTLTATVLFRDALFRSDIRIAPFPMTRVNEETGAEEAFSSGQMELCNEELLLEGLAIEFD